MSESAPTTGMTRVQNTSPLAGVQSPSQIDRLSSANDGHIRFAMMHIASNFIEVGEDGNLQGMEAVAGVFGSNCGAEK